MRRVLLSALLVCIAASVQAQGPDAFGRLAPERRLENPPQSLAPSASYQPREGDLVFFDDHSWKWGVLYKLAGSDAPYHTGMVVKRPSGAWAILEAGPDDTRWCRVLDLSPRLHQFQGEILIRQVRTPLGPEQSAGLTKFAMEQDGKRYAVCRLLLQGTPFRCRMPLRRSLFGATHLDRSSWLCAELVVAAGTTVGLFQPTVHKANSIYPRDIIRDDHYDLSAVFHSAVQWQPSDVAAAHAPPVIPREERLPLIRVRASDR